MAHLTTNP